MSDFPKHECRCDMCFDRLKADRDRWRTVADVCIMAIGIPENEIDRTAVRHYDEAVRGE